MVEQTLYFRFDDSGVNTCRCGAISNGEKCDYKQCPRPSMILTSKDELKHWNEKKYGIFFAVNTFTRTERKKEFISKIRYWFVDLDNADKEDLYKLIEATPLAPSIVVETKGGYHVYWKAKNASKDAFPRIMEKLIYTFQKKDKTGEVIKFTPEGKKRQKAIGADNNAKDLCRVLRMPGFYHWKNLNDPFLVKSIIRREVEYTDNMMLGFLKTKPNKKQVIMQQVDYKQSSDDFWENYSNMNCEYALLKLSGSSAVGSEVYTFKQNAGGTKQIIVNGKMTSCWVDQNGRIGSHDEGGPTIIQWLKWFGHNWKEIYRIGVDVLGVKEEKR